MNRSSLASVFTPTARIPPAGPADKIILGISPILYNRKRATNWIWSFMKFTRMFGNRRSKREREYFVWLSERSIAAKRHKCRL